MNREQARKWFQSHMTSDPMVNEAFDMAIEALNSYPQSDDTTEAQNDTIEKQNDAIDIVRCKDCKHWHSNTEFCGIWSFQNIAQRTLSNDYCSRAERREP